MERYRKKLSQGNVKVVKRGAKAFWQAAINIGTVTEATDRRGKVVMQPNGFPKLETKWTTKRRNLTDIECTPNKTKVGYSGIRKAEAALEEWRDRLEEQLEDEYQALLAADEARARACVFSYADQTVEEFMDDYLRSCEDSGLEASTLHGYKGCVNHIKAAFGDKTVGEVTSDDVKDLNAHMERDLKLAPTTRLRVLKVFKAAYDAKRSYIGGIYPFEKSETKQWWPRQKRPDPNPLDETSFEHVKADIENHKPTPFYITCELALRTGMRQGELAALQWCNVHMDSGAIDVIWAMGRADGGMELYRKKPKDTQRTGYSERTIPGSPKIREALKRRYDYMAEQLREAEPHMTDEQIEQRMRSLYVCGNVDGRLYHPTTMSRDWRAYSQQNELMGTKGRRPVFHALRDTFASRAMTTMSNPKSVSHVLGHRDVGFTLRTYVDITQEELCREQAKMDDVI